VGIFLKGDLDLLFESRAKLDDELEDFERDLLFLRLYDFDLDLDCDLFDRLGDLIR